MKIPSLLNRMKFLKNTRLVVIVVFAMVLVVGAVSVSAYTLNLRKNKQPVAEKAHSQPIPPSPKTETQPAAAAETKPAVSDSTSPVVSNGTKPAPTQASKPATPQVAKPRPHTSEDPAFVACTQKYNDLYVKYNADNARINAEKNSALAAIDQLYDSGYYDENSGETDPYSEWQMDRSDVEAQYNDQLTTLYNTFSANSSAYLHC